MYTLHDIVHVHVQWTLQVHCIHVSAYVHQHDVEPRPIVPKLLIYVDTQLLRMFSAVQ